MEVGFATDLTRGSSFLPLFLSLHKEPLDLCRVGKTCICMNIDMCIIINLGEETLVGAINNCKTQLDSLSNTKKVIT